jgi:predicted CopG family antitoxin
MADTTTVEIKTETWRELNARKEPGDSFDDVIRRLLDDESRE